MKSLEAGLDPTESALLRVTAEVAASNDDAIDTETAAARVVEILRNGGHSFTLFTKPPWFGLRDAALQLERLGALEIDPGMAQFVPRGTPAPTADRYFLVTTEARLRDALGRLQHIGPIRIEPTRTVDTVGKTIPWFVATIDVVCGLEIVMVIGEGVAPTIALAAALERGIERQARS